VAARWTTSRAWRATWTTVWADPPTTWISFIRFILFTIRTGTIAKYRALQILSVSLKRWCKRLERNRIFRWVAHRVGTQKKNVSVV